MTAQLIATASNVPVEFCEALASEDIAWLYHVSSSNKKPAGMMFSNWKRHNGQSAKKRAQDAQRQRDRRAKK
jgi:Holliday junction resolvasome RuvABC DNA-binding subunit